MLTFRKSNEPVEVSARNGADAYVKAIAEIRQILDADAMYGRLNLNRRLDVRDPDGVFLFSVPFSAAMH